MPVVEFESVPRDGQPNWDELLEAEHPEHHQMKTQLIFNGKEEIRNE